MKQINHSTFPIIKYSLQSFNPSFFDEFLSAVILLPFDCICYPRVRQTEHSLWVIKEQMCSSPFKHDFKIVELRFSVDVIQETLLCSSVYFP